MATCRNNILDFQDPGTMSPELLNVPGFVNELKKAVEALEPVNVTDETNWHISATVQVEPYEAADRLAADGIRKVEVTGIIPTVHAAAASESSDARGRAPCPYRRMTANPILTCR